MIINSRLAAQPEICLVVVLRGTFKLLTHACFVTIRLSSRVTVVGASIITTV